MEIVILRVLTSNLKNKWYQFLPLVPLALICIFTNNRQASSLSLVLSATTKDPGDHAQRSVEILTRWNWQPHNISHKKPVRSCRLRGSLSAPICGTWVRALTSLQCSAVRDTECAPPAGTAYLQDSHCLSQVLVSQRYSSVSCNSFPPDRG